LGEDTALLGKTDRVIEWQKGQGRDSSEWHVLEDLYCAMRLYEKALFDTMTFMEGAEKEGGEKWNVRGKEAKSGKAEGRVISLKDVELSDKDVNEILSSLYECIGDIMDAQHKCRL